MGNLIILSNYQAHKTVMHLHDGCQVEGAGEWRIIQTRKGAADVAIVTVPAD